MITAICFVSVINAQNCNLIIKNGRIADGSGKAIYRADIAVKDGKIFRIGKIDGLKADSIIDAKGLIVSPGFIDIHTHIEEDELKNPLATNFIADGVTTVITGNCGESNTNLKKYFAFLDSLKLSINVASLIGHNDVRKAIMGKAMRSPTNTELNRMDSIVEQAMKDGAVGFSTGLIYIPGVYSTKEELASLAKVAGNYGGVYCTHMRNEGDSVLYAINEALYVARTAKIPLQISHFKVGGQNNWGLSTKMLQKVKDARTTGMDVTIDQYPYTASSTALSTLLPEWVLADGIDSVKARLERPKIKKKMIAYLVQRLKNKGMKHYSFVVVANNTKDSSYNGKSIEAINLQLKKPHTALSEAGTILYLITEASPSALFHTISEKDVCTIMQYPFNMVASDGTIRVKGVGVPHPRSYGTNARVLGRYVREQHLITLEEAIKRMTSLPAQKFHLSDRGLLQEGYAADMVIFDEKTIIDQSTFINPHQYSTGISYVIVNGKVDWQNNQPTGIRNGIVLYGVGKGN
ncbi:MAG: D-aminoacylase [Bacteroidota bacterium]